LVGEQLAVATLEDGIDADEIDRDPGLQEKAAPDGAAGVEFRILYHKAREELVCSTEHQFRTLLKEFYDHQMVESRRDALGVERLIVPFRTEELEGLLEELVD
jgi:origin recognition complex subunit 2